MICKLVCSSQLNLPAKGWQFLAVTFIRHSAKCFSHIHPVKHHVPGQCPKVLFSDGSLVSWSPRMLTINTESWPLPRAAQFVSLGNGIQASAFLTRSSDCKNKSSSFPFSEISRIWPCSACLNPVTKSRWLAFSDCRSLHSSLCLCLCRLWLFPD